MIENLGLRLRRLREAKHLKQRQMAELLGVKESAVSLYESDQRNPPLETVVRYAAICNVSTDFILGCNNRNMLDISSISSADIKYLNDTLDRLKELNYLRLEKNEQ